MDLSKVRQVLVGKVMSDEWDYLRTNKEGANAVNNFVLNGHFQSQVTYIL
jgi:hypothetical protein